MKGQLAVWTRGVRKEVLPNGLTLLVQRDDSAPVVAVVTHVKAGFFDEPDRWTGISHVLEHMFFKGTATRGVGAIARETKSAGGYLNASTSYDHTSYFAVLPAASLAPALEIQADALRNSVVDAGELARELQVIIQEAKRKLDTPSALAYETLHEVMFDRHRMRRWRIGHEAQLARFTRDDVYGYYRSRYVPARTIVSIVGAVDPDEALALARATYGDWPAAEGGVDPSPEEPARREVRARTIRGDITHAELALGWRTVPPLHPDSNALDLAAAILTSGRGSWLYREPAGARPGDLGVGQQLRADRAWRVQRRCGARAGSAAGGGAGNRRGHGKTHDARAIRRGDGARADSGARPVGPSAGVHGGPRQRARHGRGAGRTSLSSTGNTRSCCPITAEQVRDAAARHLHPDAVSGVAYLPDGEGPDLTTDALAAAFAVTALEPSSPIALRPPARPTARRVAGKVEGGVLLSRLPGVDLLVRRKSGVPLVTLGIYVPKREFDPPAQAGLGALLVRSAVRGAGGLDSGDLAYAFERLGGSLTPSIASDWLGFGTSVLTEHLGEAASLLETVLSSPRLAEADVAAERGLMIAEAEQMADDMFRYPFQLAFAEAFGEEGYGLPAGGLPHTLPAVSAADVKAWHRRALLGARATVLAVGDVDPGRAIEELAGVFGDRTAPTPDQSELGGVSWVPGGGEPPMRVVSREKAQAALAMAFPGPARRDADRAAAQVWAAVASGLGGRLFEALRDRRSLAYTVVASAWQKARGGALLTYIATSPEREEEAREQMLIELERFTREPVNDAELRQAVNYLAGQAEVSRQNANAVAGEILDAWLSGSGLDELEDPAAPFRAVTAEDVLRIAAEYLMPERRAEGVVRGTGVARPPVLAAPA